MVKRKRKDLSGEIEDLIKEGTKEGVIKYEDIDRIFRDDVVWAPYLDELFARLEEKGIEIYEEREYRELALKPIEEGVDEALKFYLKEITKIPLLSAEEERQLAKQIDDAKLKLKNIEQEIEMSIRRFKRLYKTKTLDNMLIHKKFSPQAVEDIYKNIIELEKLIEESKQKFIEANLRLVVSIAFKYSSRRVPVIDLINEGNIGLIRAVDKYDYKEGFKFSTYATYWIRQAILKALHELPRVIYVPIHVSNAINKYLETASKLAQEFGREPTLGEVAEKANISLFKLFSMINALKEPISLETVVSREEETTLGEKIEDKQSISPHHLAFLNMLKEHLNELLGSLSEKEKLVIKLRYGIEENPRTLEEIGRILKLTRERVRQLELKALRKLKKNKISSELYQTIYTE